MFGENTPKQSIEQILDERGEYISSTAGFSMYPMLRNRTDTIIIRKVDRPLKKHDVPLYRLKSGKLVLHRILKVLPDGHFLIRGDNLYLNENVAPEQIIGVLKEFYRDGKHYVCDDSAAYKWYVLWVRISYPRRFLWKHKMRPYLSKIKHSIFK